MRTANIKTKYINEECRIDFRRYPAQYGGATAITLTSLRGEPMGTATINLFDYNIHPGPNQVLIKNTAENEGMVDALVEAGIVKRTGLEYFYGRGMDYVVVCNLAVTPEYV